MLRWISELPPLIVAQRESRNSVGKSAESGPAYGVASASSPPDSSDRSASSCHTRLQYSLTTEPAAPGSPPDSWVLSIR